MTETHDTRRLYFEEGRSIALLPGLRRWGLQHPVQMGNILRTMNDEFIGHLRVMVILAKWAEKERREEVGRLQDDILNDMSLRKGSPVDAWLDEVKSLRIHFK